MTNYVDTYSDTAVTAYGFYGPANVSKLFNVFYLAPFPHGLAGIEALKVFLLILTFVNAQVSSSMQNKTHILRFQLNKSSE